MIKARASGSKVYLYSMKKGREAGHRIPDHWAHSGSVCKNRIPLKTVHRCGQCCNITLLYMNRRYKCIGYNMNVIRQSSC